ncbi:glycosyl transferase family 41-domain-containing protein [Baffinella frigidus]|nr:glycosyl transferase family 41-domain-containing protein [Cryptophyta sp. CCMP2293]
MHARVPCRCQGTHADPPLRTHDIHPSASVSELAAGVLAEILRRVPHATLALLEGRQGARTNARLRAEARLLGVDPHRLLTARPQSKDLHLLRSRDFHLFLDTWKVASHSTAVDSLWAEVPVVAWSQVKMQARVCGALLQVLGLPELLARSAKDYSDLVVALATSPRARARVGRRLTAALRESPLFDTQGWVLDAERMHRLMWEVHVAQGKSAHLVVAERPR